MEGILDRICSLHVFMFGLFSLARAAACDRSLLVSATSDLVEAVLVSLGAEAKSISKHHGLQKIAILAQIQKYMISFNTTHQVDKLKISIFGHIVEKELLFHSIFFV